MHDCWYKFQAIPKLKASRCIDNHVLSEVLVVYE